MAVGAFRPGEGATTKRKVCRCFALRGSGVRAVFAPCDRCGVECLGDPDSHVVIAPASLTFGYPEDMTIYSCARCWPVVKRSCETVGVIVDQPRALRRRLRRRK